MVYMATEHVVRNCFRTGTEQPILNHTLLINLSGLKVDLLLDTV